MSESLNARLTDACFSGCSERDQTHHCTSLTAHIGAAGLHLQGIPRHPEGLPPQTTPPQVLLHHTVPDRPGPVLRQNHIGWPSGACCRCHAHFLHSILHIHMHLLLLPPQHLLQCILSIIIADLPHQRKDLCMRAVRDLTLLQSRRLARCMTMVQSPKCITSMLLTFSLSTSGAPVRLSMHSAPHTQWLLISFRKPSRLSMQSVLLTSRQGTDCTWALLKFLCRVTQVQLRFYAMLLTQAKCSQTYLLLRWLPNQDLITHTELLRAVCS